jgi:hypothetical protein
MPVPQTFADLSITPANNSPPGSETVGPLANDYFQAAFAFIKQLYTQGGVPTQALNANNQKVTNVANGVALTDAVNLGQLNTTLGAPSGTRVVFQQAAAPLGWTIDGSASFTDCSMRFNQGGGASGTGTNWSAWNYGGVFNVNGTALTVAQMAVHTHNDAGHVHGVADNGHVHGVNWSDPGHAHTGQYGGALMGPYNGTGPINANWSGGGSNMTFQNTNVSGSGISMSIQTAGTGIGIATNYAAIQNAGGGAAHGHTITTPQMKYADCCIGIKS